MSLLSELSALLVSGGVLLAASTFISKDNDREATASSANPVEAGKVFNEAVKAAPANALFLAPAVNEEPYEQLKSELHKLGIESHFSAAQHGLVVDLSPLLLPLLCFSEERKLSQDLCSVGLVLSPGESHGLQLPGRFIVSTPLVQREGVVAQIIEKLLKVISQRAERSTAAKTWLARHHMRQQASSSKRKGAEETVEAEDAASEKGSEVGGTGRKRGRKSSV
eukprot:gene36186-43890_t